MLPVCTVRDVPGLYPWAPWPPPPGFSQVFILNVLKVACFHTLLQVFILKVLSGTGFLAVVHKVKGQNEGPSLERLMDAPVSKKNIDFRISGDPRGGEAWLFTR